MAYERETITTERTTPTGSTTYVTRSTSPFGLIGGTIVAILLIVLAVLLFNGAFGGGAGAGGGTVNTDVPSVIVTPDGQ